MNQTRTDREYFQNKRAEFEQASLIINESEPNSNNLKNKLIKLNLCFISLRP